MKTINWQDKEAVIQYAKEMGAGMTVFKHPSRDTFNITHTSRKDRYEIEWVVFQT